MAHIHELIDWTAGVYIVHNNKVLIRKHDKYKIWIHVGGHVELDEDPIEAAIRECKEEVGLDIKIFDAGERPPNMLESDKYLPNPAHMNIHHLAGMDNDHRHIDLLYYATSDSDVVVPENDSDEWLWLNADEIRENPHIADQIKFYALGALKTLKS